MKLKNELTIELKTFLDLSKKLQGTDLLLTDKQTIIYDCVEDNQKSYKGLKVSNELVKIMNEYEQGNLNKYIFNQIIPIIENDDKQYVSQIILPLFYKRELIGLLINMSEKSIYTNKNLEFADTTREFIYKFIDKTNNKYE